jgi:hypothetical protein
MRRRAFRAQLGTNCFCKAWIYREVTLVRGATRVLGHFHEISTKGESLVVKDSRDKVLRIKLAKCAGTILLVGSV